MVESKLLISASLIILAVGTFFGMFDNVFSVYKIGTRHCSVIVKEEKDATDFEQRINDLIAHNNKVVCVFKCGDFVEVAYLEPKTQWWYVWE